MAAVVMSLRTCDSCGFDNAERGKRCPLCGSTAVDVVASTDTITQIPLSTPTLASDVSSGRDSGADASDRIGEIIAGRYRVDGLLGRGGMGHVYRVRDRVSGRDLALKLLQSSDPSDPHAGARIQREIAAMERVVHPCVPKLSDWGELGAQVYLVSELVYGHDLKSDIQRRGAWPATDAAALGASVADALAAAHEKEIIHRDVKPSNIMLTPDGSVMLLDFGLARLGGIDLETITRTGVAVGTPAYMSPEQFDAVDLDASTDIYSLGVVLFELLTGRLPFVSKTPIGVAVKHKSEPPPRPRELDPDIPRWLEEIVLRCLEKDPSRRPPSAASLAADLRRQRPRWRKLSSGDSLLDNAEEVSDAALELSSASEKRGWTPGMALSLQDAHYKLREVISPENPDAPWRYRFDEWPESEAFRRLVDYEEDCAYQSRLGPRLKGWLSALKPGG